MRGTSKYQFKIMDHIRFVRNNMIHDKQKWDNGLLYIQLREDNNDEDADRSIETMGLALLIALNELKKQGVKF